MSTERDREALFTMIQQWGDNGQTPDEYSDEYYELVDAILARYTLVPVSPEGGGIR